MRCRAVALPIVVLLSLCFFGRAQDRTLPDHKCFVPGNALEDSTAPTFGQYPAAYSPPSALVPLDVKSNPIARRHRTIIRQEMTHGPNYAGHYRVVSWGCGSSCSQFAVVNLKTGRVITLRNIYSVDYADFSTYNFLPQTDSESRGFRFKKDSNLLVLVGNLVARSSKKVGFQGGASYYVLKNEDLEFVHRTRVTHRTCPP